MISKAKNCNKCELISNSEFKFGNIEYREVRSITNRDCLFIFQGRNPIYLTKFENPLDKRTIKRTELGYVPFEVFRNFFALAVYLNRYIILTGGADMKGKTYDKVL